MSGGATQPNDPSIPNDADLWRRIPPAQMTEDDQVPSGRRPSTANFDDPELSVVIAAECTGGLETLLQGLPTFGVASFTAGDVRRLGLGVVRVQDESLPGHAHVTGHKTKSTRNRLARSCRMVRYPGPA